MARVGMRSRSIGSALHLSNPYTTEELLTMDLSIYGNNPNSNSNLSRTVTLTLTLTLCTNH